METIYIEPIFVKQIKRTYYKVVTKNIRIAILTIVLFIGYFYRLAVPLPKDITKGDFQIFYKSVENFINGKNIYYETVKSYQELDRNPGDKGYAYFPGYLYLYCILVLLENIVLITANVYIPPAYLYLLPFMVVHLLTLLLLFKILDKQSLWIKLFAAAFWIMNPIATAKGSFEGRDVIPIMLCLLALYFIETDDVLAGTFYALSIMFKTYPIILFPLLVTKSHNKLNFLISGSLIGITMSFPFIQNLQDILTYIRGAVFVHSERFIQGQPFLWYIRYHYKIEFFELIPFKFYAIASIVGGWLITIVILLQNKFNNWLKNKWVISSLAFVNFYIFTPVLNRSYLLWGIPIFLATITTFDTNKRFKTVFIVFLSFLWIFLTWYLIQWKDGFHIWHPI